MSRTGYGTRLALCFGADPEHYRPEPDLTPEAAADEQAALARRLLPPAWLGKAVLRPSILPTVHHTHKEKCLNPAGGGSLLRKTPRARAGHLR